MQYHDGPIAFTHISHTIGQPKSLRHRAWFLLFVRSNDKLERIVAHQHAKSDNRIVRMSYDNESNDNESNDTKSI